MDTRGMAENANGDRVCGHGEVQGGSKEEEEVMCTPCSEDGEYIHAKVFCQHCQEHLCKSCIKVHRRTSVLKDHQLVDKSNKNIVATVSKTSPVDALEVCAVHDKQVIKFYCPDHDQVGCGDCTILHHRNCSIQYISDVAAEFIKSPDFLSQEKEIERLTKNVHSFKAKLKETLVDNVSERALNEFEKFRTELNDSLSARDSEIRLKSKKLKDENLAKIEGMNQNCQRAETVLAMSMDAKRNNTKGDTAAYVIHKRIGQELKSIKDDMKKLEKSCSNPHNDVKQYTFLANTVYGKLISDKSSLGAFGKKPTKPPASTISEANYMKEIYEDEALDPYYPEDFQTADIEKCGEINTRHKDETSLCNVCTIACVSVGRIVFLDNGNKNIKLIDTQGGSVISMTSLPAPYSWKRYMQFSDVTVLDKGNLAVSFAYETIHLYSTNKDNIQLIQTISNNQPCNSISYYKGKLALAFNWHAGIFGRTRTKTELHPMVELRTLKGNYMSWSITTNEIDMDKSIFKNP